MAKEPRGFHAASERALNLPGAHSLLAGANELDRLQPQMQREMAILEDRTDPHRERLAAGVTLSQAGAASFPRQATDSLFFAIPTVGANRAFRPQMGFYVRKSRFLIMEMGG
jgi:hypothetical protein